MGASIRLLLLTPGVMAASACAWDGGGADRREVVRSDSAGVEIVLDRTPPSAIPLFAVLDSIPDLRLGSLDGTPEEQFGTVVDVEVLPDGRIAVLDGQAGEIRVFGSDGRHLASMGSRGEGPGEFERPIELALLSGDTIAVYDAAPRRITRFGLDGTRGRITTLEDTRSRIVAASFLPDGRMLGQSRWLAPDGGVPPASEPTLVRDTAVLTLFTIDGRVADTIDVVPGAESIVRIEMTERSISVFKRLAAFGRNNVFAVHPEGVWTSQNDRFELRLRDLDGGDLTRIVRAPELELPIADELARLIEARASSEAETVEHRNLLESWYSLSPRPETAPAFDLFAVDDGEHLWARDWSTSLAADTRWWVFGRRGELLGVVHVPSRMRIVSAGCDGVVGVEQGDLGLGYVVRYRVRSMAGC